VSDVPTTVVIAPAPPPDFIQLITGGRLSDSEFVFAVAVVVLLRTLWNAKRRGLDLTDLFVGEDGKLSWSKLLACTGGVAATWGFVMKVLDNTMTEWYFNGYMAACFGTAVWMKYLAGTRAPPPTSPPAD
jgi:hypothetical protein